MADVFNTFNTEVERKHQEMLGELESISVDNLKSEGLTISLGGKTFKFTDLEVVQDEDVEEKLRREFKEKLNTQQQRIREKINSKINQLLLLHQQKQQEMDRKEKKMKRMYADAAMMPELKQSHYLKGLSVSKGASNDELIWFYRGVYNPRFILFISADDNVSYSRNKVRKAIPDALVNRMKQPLIIQITTKKNKVTNVQTRKLNDGVSPSLSSFSHYHLTRSGDCWGNWDHPTDFNSPDDILNIAKEAEAILETINQGSIASRGPSGLPRLQTILNAVKDLPETSRSRSRKRKNVSDEIDEDVWDVSI